MARLSLLLLLAGCLKNPAVTQAPSPMPVAVATVLESTEAAGVQAVPDEVTDRLIGELERRNLVPQSLDGTAVGAGSSTDHRIAWMTESASGAKAVLLVETEARFSTQVNGRYRWNVTGTISLVPTGPEEPLTADLNIPVALVYSHQDEADALIEASPLVARRVGSLLEGWLASDTPR